MSWFLSAFRVAGLALLVAAGARATTPAPSSTEFELRFVPLRYLVLDPRGSYSFSEIYPKLEETEQMARHFGTDSPERARTLDLMTLVLFKHEDFDQVLRLGVECLDLKSVETIPLSTRILLMHRVAKAADQLHRYAVAADRYRAVLNLDASANDTLLDDAQRLGVLERLGYVLHEDGRYDEALAANRKVLADAERIFGARDERLTTVLIDMAQNLYKLGQLDGAESTLQRCLALAQRVHKNAVVDEALFQLGALAFERGDVDGARRRMKERIQIAEQAHDTDRLTRATQAADELERRIAKH